MTLPPPDAIDLTGLIDLHIHSAPDVQPRLADDIETARAAGAAGMRAILLKSHVTLTADRAYIAERVVDGVRVWGGLALNHAVGGFNPRAAEVALQLGARQIWMPTHDAANDAHYRHQPGGLSPLDANGQVLPAVYEILSLIARAGAILGTGHLSIGETITLVDAARAQGVHGILVTHPEAPFIRMPVPIQRELAESGAYLERCFVFTTSMVGAPVSIAEIAAQIRAVGIHSTILSTDLGQVGNPPPTEGLREYIASLCAQGLTLQEVRQAAGNNPAALLGL